MAAEPPARSSGRAPSRGSLPLKVSACLTVNFAYNFAYKNYEYAKESVVGLLHSGFCQLFLSATVWRQAIIWHEKQCTIFANLVIATFLII